MNNQAFNLTLEIVQGCKFKCNGCMVDKGFDPGDFGADTEDMTSLVDAMATAGYRLRELTIGPVDITASSTGLTVLDNPLIIELSQRFDSMVLPLALLNDDHLEELTAKVNVLMAGKSITIATPFSLKSISNEKHHRMIKNRLAYVENRLPDVKLELLYLTVNMTSDTMDLFTIEANKAIHDIDFGVNRLIEYVFPHVRKGFDDLLNRSAFLRAFWNFCEVIQSTRGTKYNRYLIKPHSDSLELTYRSGHLYYTPTLIEKFPIFDQSFVLDRPWTVDTVEQFVEEGYIKELTERSGTALCGSCIHLNNCARGDIHAIMTHLGLDQCLVDMKDKWDVLV